MTEIEYVCSLGVCCHTAEIIKRYGYKLESYPFDWLVSAPKIIGHCIEDDFNKLLDRNEYLPVRGQEQGKQCGHSFYSPRNMFNHINPLVFQDDYEYLLRCVDRFRELLRRTNNKLFIILSPNHTDPKDVKLFVDQVNNLDAILKKHSINFSILAVIHYVSDLVKHTITKVDNVIICELYNKSKSNGRKFLSGEDNNYLDKIVNEYYNFKVKSLNGDIK